MLELNKIGIQMPDIDIDFLDRTDALRILKHIPAAIEDNGTFKKHNTGVYCTSIPYNPLTGMSTIDYKQAEERGYFKIDFLNVSIYKGVRDETHLKQLMEIEPLWDLLEQDDFTNLLFHVNGHGHVLRTMKPKDIESLAACLAIIRPAKKHLLGKLWTEVLQDVWTKPTTDEYYFKKAHAVAYAMAIVVQMNLICEGISYEYA
jgi:DNA polymerase III alpha subunit